MLEVSIRDRVGDLLLDADFRAEPGEVVALTGASGSGKTTLLRAIAGLRMPAGGRVGCSGMDWFDRERDLWVPPESRRVGMVFQEYALFPRMRAVANVAFATNDLPRGERREAALEAMRDVGLSGFENRRPGTLSGGERQRLALARAIALRPSLLLLDEPLASLDPPNAEAALGVIEATVARLDVPCVLVTHDPLVTARAGSVIRLEDGRARASGRPPD